MNNRAKITCGNATLTYTNRIICFDSREIRLDIQLTEDKNDILKLRFVFEYTDDDKINMSINPKENGSIVIRLINFKNPLGTGLKKPLRVAKINDNYVYIIFNVNKAEGASPILDLSVYVGSDDE